MIFPLAGNDGVKSSIELSLKNNRLPHAIIIEGESGSGKSVLAQYIASAALCSEDDKPCGKCKGCHLVKAGTHPDMFYIAPEDKKKNIAVDQIRKMRNEAYIRPQMSNRKVFNIDFADTMNPQSQNTILKILEEPPGDTLFILQVHSRSSLLATILSRCVTYTLKEPPIDIASEYLSENEGISKEEAINMLEKNGNQIGKVLEAIGSRKKNGTYEAALEYLQTAENGKNYDLLLITLPFEKDRVKAGEFFSHLSYLLLLKAKETAVLGGDTSKVMNLCKVVKESQEMLNGNINLTLLFSALAAKFI